MYGVNGSRLALVLLFSIAYGLPSVGAAQATGKALTRSDKIANDLDAYLREWSTAGGSAAVLVDRGGTVLLQKGYGLADRTRGTPISPNTGFDLGSLVKPFTAAAVLKLEDQRKLRLNDTLSKYFKNAPPDAGITVAQLLDHTAGLTDIVDKTSTPVYYAPDFDFELVSREEIVRRALSSKLLSKPGERFHYSNLGYSLLGVIIGISSKRSDEQYLNEQPFRSAGMKITGSLTPKWKTKDLAVGYQDSRPWGTPLDHQWLSDGPLWNLRANGRMISTEGDLHKWIAALEHERILSTAAKRKYMALDMHITKSGRSVLSPSGSNEIFFAVYV